MLSIIYIFVITIIVIFTIIYVILRKKGSIRKEILKKIRNEVAPISLGKDDIASEPFIYVWYCTNRKPYRLSNTTSIYLNDRGHKTHYGLCRVKVPESHKIGSIGSSWWRRKIKSTDDRLKVTMHHHLRKSEFWQLVSWFLGDCQISEQVALVFIHGFNTSFDEAILRAAQIGYDIKFPGITALYSWPSKGNILGYAADVASLEGSAKCLREFLINLSNTANVKKVHIIAQSMGNRGLLKALTQIDDFSNMKDKYLFDQIILAAPDIDRDEFIVNADIFSKISNRTTLYASSKDKALASSGILHDFPRAGYIPPITITKYTDTIEVTSIDLTFLGHGYVAGAKGVLYDMYSLIRDNKPPEERFGLSQKSYEDNYYWQLNR